MESQPSSHAASVRRSLPRNIATDIGARIAYLVTRLAVPPFVLAHIALSTYGLWTTAFVVVSYIGISTMGLSSVYIKYVAEFSAKGEFERANRLLSSGLAVTIPVCVSTFVAMCFIWPSLSHFLHVAPALQGDAREVVLTVVAIFLASIGLSGFRDALVAEQRTAQVQVIWIVSFVLETALIFLLVGLGRGIRGLAEAFLVRTILEIGLAFWLAFRSLPWLRISASLVELGSLKLLFNFGTTAQVLSFLAVALNSIERAVAAPLVGLDAAALLDLAKKLPTMAGSVPMAFATSLVPAASFLQGGLHDGSEESEEWKQTVHKLYYKGARYMNLLAGLSLALPACTSGLILYAWIGKHYQGGALLMTAFCLSTQANLLTGPGTSILRGIGKINEEFYYALPNIAFLAATLPLSRFLLHAWTAVGVGLAVAVSTLLAAAIFLVRAHKVLGIPLQKYARQVLLPGFAPFLVGLPMGAVGLLFFTHLSRWEEVGALTLLGSVYMALCLLLIAAAVLTEGEKLWFRAMIPVKRRPARRASEMIPTSGD